MRMAMMAITTSSSISVKPSRRAVVENCGIAEPLRKRGMLVTLGDFARERYVPDLDGRIAASRNQPPAVRAERQAADKAGVTPETADQLSGVTVPDFHGAVLAARGDPTA